MLGRVREVVVAGEADVAAVRVAVREVMADCPPDLVHSAELVATELVTNALLHGGGTATASVALTDTGARLEVADASPQAPLLGAGSADGMTGRGLAVVARLAARWGAEPGADGKVVWAELEPAEPGDEARTEDELLATWPDLVDEPPETLHVTLGEVPTALLVAAKRHVDNLLREFALASLGERAGTTAPVPGPLAELIESVVHRFAEARVEIKRQATAAARAGARHTVLELELPLSVADAAQEYADALDALDVHSRANRLLTLETPPQHRVFRRWYIGEIVAQLRAAQEGRPGPPPVRFEDRLLEEVEAAEAARRAADRAARLYTVATALATARSDEEVAAVVLREGVIALGATGGGVLLDSDGERLGLAGTLGYDERVVDHLRSERRDADLPAAHSLRTGETVWLEAVEDHLDRYPGLAEMEPGTRSLCVVPVRAGTRIVGALRFSFAERRVFGTDERRFTLALAAEASEALFRIDLETTEREARRRLENEWLTVEKLAAVGEAMLRGRDLPTIVQLATDAATQVAGAEVGAFFHNGTDERGERFTRWALAGAPREAFASFPLPRDTEIFAPTSTGEAIVRLDDVTADPRFGRNAPFHGLPPGHLPVRSYLAVPVTLQSGEVVGGLYLGHAEPGRFGPDVERLVVGVAGQAGAAIENVRSLQGRAHLAAVVARTLLAPPLPAIEGVELGAVYRAAGARGASVGGDFYDVFPVGPDRWGIVIGDVRGRGPEAATLTALTRYTIRTAARLGLGPAAVLGAVNQAIHAEGDPERFCTAVYGLLSVADDGIRLAYANGGHPSVLVARRGAVGALPTTGGLLGAFPDTDLTEEVVELEPGDVVVLYTDGVSEVRCEGEEFGERCLAEAVAAVVERPAQAVADHLVAESNAFGGGAVGDDVAVLVLGVGRTRD